MSNPIIFTLIKFLHDVASAMWIGGLIAMVFVILPSTKKTFGVGKERKAFMDIVMKKMSLLVYISIPILFVTGLFIGKASGLYIGILSLGNEYSTLTTIKHVLYALMIVIAIFRSQIMGKWPKLGAKKQEKLSASLLFINLGIGLVVLFLSAYLSSISLAIVGT
ncbi:MAG: hypothetical protein ACTSPV_11575 [Candidatus Hodarchaeales archaeon]